MYYPSTANGKKNDITIERCVNIAQHNNYGGIYVYNIHNDVFNSFHSESSDLVIAWGKKLSKQESKDKVKELEKKI